VKLSPSSRHYGQGDTDPTRTFSHAVRVLDELGVAYVHVMEPNAQDLAAGGVPTDNARWCRPLFRHALIANGRLRRPARRGDPRDGTADLVSFGVPFIANPDLPRRLAGGGPFNAPDPSTFYGEGPRGYTDYPRSEAR
jgi:N-ethylmaleimide reductase